MKMLLDKVQIMSIIIYREHTQHHIHIKTYT